MGIIERPRSIHLIEYALKFIFVWFSVAGVVHLTENSGDFFCDYCNIAAAMMSTLIFKDWFMKTFFINF
jgi:hypothetical protein